MDRALELVRLDGSATAKADAVFSKAPHISQIARIPDGLVLIIDWAVLWPQEQP